MTTSKKRTGASSPEARAKAVETMKKRRAEKLAAEKFGPKDEEISLDAIPDPPVRKKYTRRLKPFIQSPLSQEQMDTVKALLRAALKMMEG